MSIKTLLLSVAFAAIPMTAGASDSTCAADASLRHGGFEQKCGYSKRDECRAYNRDGITCAEVGMFEGTTGAPWGDHAGTFTCVNGCLQWVGLCNAPIEICKEPVQIGKEPVQIGKEPLQQP